MSGEIPACETVRAVVAFAGGSEVVAKKLDCEVSQVYHWCTGAVVISVEHWLQVQEVVREKFPNLPGGNDENK